MSILPKASRRGEIRRACPSVRKHIEALTAKLQQPRVSIAWPGERVQHNPDRHPRNPNCEFYRRDQRRDCARRCHRGGWRRWTPWYNHLVIPVQGKDRTDEPCERSNLVTQAGYIPLQERTRSARHPTVRSRG